VLVVDASVLVVALADDGPDGDTARSRLGGQRLFAPEIIDLEVLSVLRRLTRTGNLDPRRAQLALVDLAEIPLQRASHRPLLHRSWELSHNLSTYDAAYVTLAEVLGATLLTADTRMAAAPGVRCQVEVITTLD
jgi:predicted nucleic acid-binding protein